MSTVPGRRRFIGDTIGVHFDRIVERFAERDALIVSTSRSAGHIGS
jgi:hypothetical protein